MAACRFLEHSIDTEMAIIDNRDLREKRKQCKVKCPKIEGMMPKLMKMVKGEMKKYEINSMGESVSTVTAGMVAMVSQHTMTRVNES